MIYKFSIFFCILNFITSSVSADYTLDHAVLDHRHVQDAENFITKHFKTESGEYSVEKVTLFIERLQFEREELARDMYETKIIERLNYDISDISSAKDDAKDELNSKKNAFLKGYDKVLIPRISELLKAVNDKKDKTTCDAIVQDFIRMYIVYYAPEIKRHPWMLDLQPKTAIRFLTGFKYNKTNNEKVESNNLIVDDANQKQIAKCLNVNIDIGTYLTQNQIESLVNCSFDISKLNPGKSPYWHVMDDHAIREAKNLHEEYFPKDDEQMYFQNIRLSGQGSPKLTGYVLRNGKKVKYKVKFGYEVHTSIAASILSKLMGFHQDTFQPRKELKLYLKNTTYESFITQWRRKYDTNFKNFDIFIKEHGGTKGNEWVVLKDIVLNTLAEPDTDRLDGYLTTSWDLNNRREHRASILWLGFMNIIDTKPSNYLVKLKNLANGEIEPQYMLADTGMSLVYGYSARFPLQLLKNWTWSVNAFHPSFLKFNKKQVTIGTIGWTPFETTTYNDVKWMARKIAAISHDDIKYAFEKAEFPKEVQDLYVHKISARRNEIIKAFDLEKEFPLYQVPNLDHYSPNKIVKNGKITVKTFDGYTTLEHSRQGFNLDIFNAITQALPLNTMSEHFNAKISGSSALNFSNYESFVKSGDFSNGISHKGVWGGVGVSMNRRVMLNNMHAINVSPENTHGYLTIDTISVEFNIGSGLFGELFKDNPLGLDLNLNVFKREYTMIQPANSLKDALLNALRIPSFVLNNRDNIVFGLHANEYVMIRNGYGFSASVSQSIPIAQTGMSMSINPSLSWNHSDPVYFGRDSFGQLFVYKEDASSMTFGLSGSANIGQRNIPLIKNMPLISESFYTTWYNFDSGLYLFKLPEYVLGGSQLDFHHYQQEYNAFNEFMNANSHDPVVLARRAFTIDGKGRQKKFNLDILKFFHRQQIADRSEVKYTDAKGETREFIRATYRRNNRVGSDIGGFDGWGGGMTTKLAQNTIASVEVDLKNLDKSVCYITDVDYYRNFNRKNLLQKMDKINMQFSQNESKPFFAGHRLPEKDEVDRYNKLYNRSFVFLDCGKLFSLLESLNLEDVLKREEIMMGKHYLPETELEPILEDIGTNASSDEIEDGQKNQSGEIKLKKIHILGNLRKYISKYRKNQISSYRLAANTARLLSRYVFQGGTMKGLAEWIGEKNIFVTGEILGLLPSFSPLQSFEAVIERRFTGQSWGGFENGAPPIRVFVKEHLLRPYNFHVSADPFVDSIFGELPQVDDIEFY